MWYCGLDLGQAADYTALVALDRDNETMVYRCRHLHRFPLNTPYTTQVDQVISWLAIQGMEGCSLVVDHTGVGRAVVDLLLSRNPPVSIVPVTITAGLDFSGDRRGGFRVPKKDLVTALNLVLQQRRMKIPRTLALADTLATELGNFKVKVTAAANETFGAWREGQHDDLVLALAMAVWYSEEQNRYLTQIARASKQSVAYVAEPEEAAEDRVQLKPGVIAGKPTLDEELTAWRSEVQGPVWSRPGYWGDD